mgnify:CR=1 FL=1
MGYSSLHNHTMFSLLDGYGTPKEMLEQCRNVGISTFAVTEHGNQYSWVYFDKLSKDYPDIKIIYGVELYECFDTTVRDKNNKYFHLIALAKNENGRKALNKIITKSNLKNFYYKPRVSLSDISPYANDLIICSACLASKLARENDYNQCIKYINEYKLLFPNFYLEMQSHKSEIQAQYNRKILQLSIDTNTPFVITTDSHAATKEDLYYQARHVQIAHDSETMSESYEGCYLQSEEEIYKIMSPQIGANNVTVGLEQSNRIANMIDEVHMPFQSPQLPTYPLPEEYNSNYDYLLDLIKSGWKQRGFDKLTVEEQEVRKKRLDYEMSVIHQMKFDGYFIIVWDFINYAKTHGVKVGSGRGSGAGSLVCYTIGITDLDPIKYGLIFERFLNPERVSMPDLDLDVSDRTTVINYLTNKYGENRVCQIINFLYITPVLAIKDVGKVLGFQYTEMDKLSKRFSYDTFGECIEHNKDFLSEHTEYNELIEIASKLSGRVKTVSCHAGGIGIVDSDISDYMAMKLGSKGEHVIEVDKREIEEIGIIKFDILGVRTLKMVQEIQNDLGLSDYDININNPEFEKNKLPFKLLNKGLTNGVFQVESAGMKDLLLRLQVNSIEDLSAVLALYRPDSMGVLEEFIACKHNPSLVKYIHPDMKPILENTYGCLVYQEQILDIVRKFGGRSYGGADLFRKAIGKKNADLVKKESEKLYQEIINNGYSEQIAEAISNELKTKGGYCFNKSHSYSYAILCFQTAYLKAKYSTYFFKALFNLNKNATGMVNKYIIDSRQFDVVVLPPHINRSEVDFSINDNNILFGLSAITGVGETVAQQIIKERSDNGKFISLKNLTQRVNLTKAQVINFVKSGAIPTKNKRKCLINYLKSFYKPTKFKMTQHLPSYSKIILDYGIDIEQFRIGKGKFDYDKKELLKIINEIKSAQHEQREKERLQNFINQNQKYLVNEPFWEFEALQIFINNNPFSQALLYLTTDFEQIEIGNDCVIVGIIAKIQKKKDKNRNQYAFVNIYSTFGLIEGIVWNSQLRQYDDLLKKSSRVAIRCRKEGEDKIIVQGVKSYDKWINERRKYIERNGI